MRIVSPSVLSADFQFLDQEIKMLESSAAEWLHFDVMDGVFVPNISFGFPILKAAKRAAKELVMDVHLMIIDPEKYLHQFVEAGADVLTFHLESTTKAKECIEIIKSAGAKAGVSIKPGTEAESLREYLPYIDMVLIMSVEPGFGGQSFIDSSLDKARELRAMAEELRTDIIIEMDGGLSSKNSRAAFDAGVDVVVAGNAVFSADDPHAEIIKILNS